MPKRVNPRALPPCASAPLARRGSSPSDPSQSDHSQPPATAGRRHFSAAERAALRQEFWQAPNEALLSRAITAAGIGYTIGWLEWAATHGGGPPWAQWSVLLPLMLPQAMRRMRQALWRETQRVSRLTMARWRQHQHRRREGRRRK